MSSELETVGKTAGTVYFTSTLGGIAATFFFGLYFIPVAGLRLCATVTGLALAALPSDLHFDEDVWEFEKECTDNSALSKAAACRRTPKALRANGGNKPIPRRTGAPFTCLPCSKARQ